MQIDVVPAARWARAVAERLAASLRRNPTLVMCLPTGTTPMPAYAELADAVRAGRATFADATVFLLDEFGGVPAGHPARCDGQLRRELLDRIDLALTRFHAFDMGAVDVEAECARVDAALAGNGLDLAVLGLGLNGHVGMNEPGSAQNSPTRRIRLAPETIAGAKRLGADTTWGVTVGMAALTGAREVWLLVTGERKAQILADVMRGPITPALPASLLREHPGALVLADEAAAALL